MPPKEPETPEQAAHKLEHHRMLNRERQKRFYANNVNKEKILEKRKDQRRVYREYKKGNLANNITAETEGDNENIPENEVYYDEQEEPRPEPPPREPTVEKLTTMPEADIMKIRKVPCNSKQTFDSIVAKIRERITNSKKQSEATLRNYITTLALLYRATGTPIEKAINLNNPQRLFLQLDACLTVGKTPRPYAFSSKTNWIQMVVLLADPRNDFKLQVKTGAFQIFDAKLKELQILGQERGEQKTKDNQYASVPPFSKIVERAKAKFGSTSKFYLLLKLYSVMRARDNFDLVIVRSENEAREERNYVVIPPLRATRMGNQSPIANIPGKVILKVYKTSKTYGTIVSNLDKETLKLTRDYMETNKINYGQYIFGSKSQSKFVRDCLREIGITVKGQNINVLRHSISSETRNKGLTAAQEAELSRSMGHNPTTSKLYSRKMKED